MDDKSIVNESKIVGKYRIYEFRIGEDAYAIEAFGKLLQKLSEKETESEGKLYEAVFSKISVLMGLGADEVYHIVAAGLRKTYDEAKKISSRDIVKLFPEIIDFNKYFFAETPEMVGSLQMVLLPSIPENDSTSKPMTDTSTTKKTS